MIKRERYLKKIREFYDSDLIKVITGVRRCGKSIILEEIMEEIAKTTDNIIYLNFEKSIDLNKASTAQGLIDYVIKNRKDSKCYIFLDEIQEIENWQKAVKDLRMNNVSIFITGSNSKLLSGEFMTLLSGRFVSFRIRPFVYKEISEFAKEMGKEVSINDYLVWGGFPYRFNLDTIDAVKDYLYELERTIVYNDLIKRYKIKKEVMFKKIVNFILKSNSRIISARSIHKTLNNEFDSISINTVIKYLDYLKQAFIIDEVSQYSKKAKKDLAYYAKLYNCDVCFNSLSVMNNRYDYDHNLENVVYNELLYMGYDVKVYDNNGKEVDFYATKNGKEYYIQVAYSVVDEKAYEREFSAFANIDNNSQRIIITTDNNDYSTSMVRHIKLIDFLMMEEL